jgi:Helix-turn-helix domain
MIEENLQSSRRREPKQRPNVHWGARRSAGESTEDNRRLDKLLTENEAAELRRQSVRTLQAERLRGGGCPFVKLGRSVRYRLSDVQQFIHTRIRNSTTEVDDKGASR